jgi:cell division protein FtsZ
VAGQPSPEALARLQAAVSRPGAAPAKAARPVAPVPQAAPVAQPAASAKPRFGIGSLINRMAGHLEANGTTAATARTQPPVTAYDDDHDMGSDQDRIEIPAFLRRQAN